MKGPWQVPVADLLRHPGSKRDVEVTGDLSDVAVTASRVPSGGLASFAGTVESLDGGAVRVRGRVRTTWEGECRRCLGDASGDLDVDVGELYEREPESEDIYPLTADRLDLEPLVRDAIYLELPQAPLCKADCRGLCPECGADRNTVDCGHAVDEMDPRWAALRELGDQN
ncbi:MAG TPA: DUF177 domain-containing protein [Acidimicrobiales bacterium]|nr:DUF177 domain-containing protein [Acidimicrobiales bacterium]